MKKNDVMGYIVYALMLGGAVGVGFGVIRPILNDTSVAKELPMPGILLILLSVLVGAVLSAVVLELGHVLGAKIGGYKVTSWNCLGLCWKRGKDNKFKFGFGGFDGLTGETKVVPNDVEKSNPRPMIFMPLVLFLVEVVLCVVLMVLGQNSTAHGMKTLYIVGLVVLTVGLLIFVYDIFPAALDSKNDGAYILIFNNKTNVQAFNQILMAEDKMAHGEDIGETQVYESVTDFTVKLNDVALYKALQDKNYDEALRINEFTIKCKNSVNSKVYLNAVAQKMALHLYLNPFEEAKEEYIGLKLEEKKFIANLSTGPAVRAYILISGLVEESEGETKLAMDKAESAIKTSGEDKRAAEEYLMKEALKKIVAKHKDWDFSEYGDLGLGEEKKEEK